MLYLLGTLVAGGLLFLLVASFVTTARDAYGDLIYPNYGHPDRA